MAESMLMPRHVLPSGSIWKLSPQEANDTELILKTLLPATAPSAQATGRFIMQVSSRCCQRDLGFRYLWFLSQGDVQRSASMFKVSDLPRPWNTCAIIWLA